MIADLGRAVGSNNNHPTGVVKPALRALNLPTSHNSRIQKDTHLKICK